MGGIQLSPEQRFLLRRVEIEAREMSREGLVNALVSSWEVRFRMKQAFTDASRSAGCNFRIEVGSEMEDPTSEEELLATFGHLPTQEEYERRMREIHEDARMELDMAEIVLAPDD